MDFFLTYLAPPLSLLAMSAVLVMMVRHRRRKAKLAPPRPPLRLRALVALLCIVVALPAGFAVGFAVMFGPSYLTGDFIGLPWLTMFPALAIGGWVYEQVRKKISARILKTAAAGVHA